MDEPRFQKWIEIAKALSLDPDSKPLCPACEKSDLQVLDMKVPGSAATYERNIWCEACGARVAVLQPQDRQRTETTSAAAEQWQRVQARLVGLGWYPHTAEGITGLLSPNDAMFVDARVTGAEFRASMISSLGRQVATIQQYREQGFYPPDTERAHRDFQQALDCLLDPCWTDKPNAGAGQGLDSRWFVDGRQDGPVLSDCLPDGRPFLYRDMWVHDALELDPSTRTAVYRDQGHTESDDPRDWAASPVPLRRHSGRWQTLVEQTTWERWMQEHESSLASCKKYAEHYPSSLATDQVAGAIRRLEEIRSIGCGWTDLAEDVSAALDEHFVMSDKLHIVGKPDIIDWYDGVISALVDVGDDRMPHLCLALAWSPDYDVRVYGLIPISEGTASALRSKLGKSPGKLTWNDITDAMVEVERAYKGLVAIIATESLGKEILGQFTLPAEDIPELRLHTDRVGHTYDETRLLAWLERLGVPKPLSWPEKDRARPSADAFLSVHLQRLDLLLQGEGRPPLDQLKVCFVLAHRVRHEPARWPGKPGEGSPILRETIARKDFMTMVEFTAVLAEILEGGPSWIHANLTRSSDGDEIIDIDAGEPIDNRWPSPNVSFVPHVVDVTITE